MKAAVGDRLVLESTSRDRPDHVGIIVALRHPDGSPPYVVRWLDEEHEVLVFPGPRARIERRRADPAESVWGTADRPGSHAGSAAERRHSDSAE
ncbi:DUF1918 domain-containing protein [Microtetraspora malaysiensis]|uniref:DUF1918 domain-containing protein n=1 Tax=Microtetraspora malaysiensis TaxID=161358 RepID=UPI003D8D8F71